MIEYHYGGFWRRAVAAIIDQVILHIVYLLLFMAGTMAGITGIGDSSFAVDHDDLLKITSGLMLLFYGFCMLINVGYFTYFHGTAGQTPGKMAMGLKVIQKTGEPVTLGIAFLRWVGYIVSSFFLFLGYLWVAFDAKKQGWHDKIAGTVVILKKEKYLDKEEDI